MASFGIRCGGSCGGFDNRFVNVRPSDQKAGPRSLAIDGRRARKPVSTLRSFPPMKKRGKDRGHGDEVVSRDKLDLWMRESVVDIVKNLREAPLFLRFYSSDGGETARFETEKAVVKERWPVLEEQWESGASPVPEGVIFVQELEDDDSAGAGAEFGDDGSDLAGESKAWGIVIQGRGMERSAPVCYLLKTSSAAELGLWCTHFCLVRVKNFRETTKSQLQNCWLLQYQ